MKELENSLTETTVHKLTLILFAFANCLRYLTSRQEEIEQDVIMFNSILDDQSLWLPLLDDLNDLASES
jgi:hypothetical protein